LKALVVDKCYGLLRSARARPQSPGDAVRVDSLSGFFMFSSDLPAETALQNTRGRTPAANLKMLMSKAAALTMTTTTALSSQTKHTQFQ
jgi:hypothetical protein